jgi:hypothetical protein
LGFSAQEEIKSLFISSFTQPSKMSKDPPFSNQASYLVDETSLVEPPQASPVAVYTTAIELLESLEKDGCEFKSNRVNFDATLPLSEMLIATPDTIRKGLGSSTKMTIYHLPRVNRLVGLTPYYGGCGHAFNVMALEYLHHEARAFRDEARALDRVLWTANST